MKTKSHCEASRYICENIIIKDNEKIVSSCSSVMKKLFRVEYQYETTSLWLAVIGYQPTKH